MSNRFPFERSLFVVSSAVLALLYGFAACAAGWFPKQFLLRAWAQAEQTWVVSEVDKQIPGLLPVDRGNGILHPRIYEREGARTLQPEKVQPGLTLITADGRKAPELKLLDQEGAVVHEWTVDRKAIADSVPTNVQGNVHGSHLLPNGKLLVNIEYAGTVRLNACGQIKWQLPRGHHSINRTEESAFWIPTVSKKPQVESKNYPNGFPGLDKPVFIDRVHLVSKDGKVLNTNGIRRDMS